MLLFSSVTIVQKLSPRACAHNHSLCVFVCVFKAATCSDRLQKGEHIAATSYKGKISTSTPVVTTRYFGERENVEKQKNNEITEKNAETAIWARNPISSLHSLDDLAHYCTRLSQSSLTNSRGVHTVVRTTHSISSFFTAPLPLCAKPPITTRSFQEPRYRLHGIPRAFKVFENISTMCYLRIDNLRRYSPSPMKKHGPRPLCAQSGRSIPEIAPAHTCTICRRQHREDGTHTYIYIHI